MNTTTQKFKIGDKVTITAHQAGAWQINDQPAVVVSTDTHAFCPTCHCDPVNPDHRGDGSLCCPGPFYAVESGCVDGNGHRHFETYAEHELR